MAEIEDVVRAEIQLRAARAALALADLVERQRRTIMTLSNANVRLALGRKIQRARAVCGSWDLIIALMDAEDSASGVAVIKELREALAAPPGRTVAWISYALTGPNTLVCNRRNPDCRNACTPEATWVPMNAADLPDGEVCAICGTDVLA